MLLRRAHGCPVPALLIAVSGGVLERLGPTSVWRQGAAHAVNPPVLRRDAHRAGGAVPPPGSRRAEFERIEVRSAAYEQEQHEPLHVDLLRGFVA